MRLVKLLDMYKDLLDAGSVIASMQWKTCVMLANSLHERTNASK